jgi:threonine/homoserine/homoserine lactone efflux protein
MTITQSLLLYAIAAGLLTITPGLDTAFVLRTSATQGPRPAAFAALGIGAGCLVWGAATATGLTALFTAAPLAFEALKWVGTAYLVWLGLKLIFSKADGVEVKLDAGAAAGGRPGLNALRRGFLTNLLNPKVGVFYVTFLPQFVPIGVQPGGPAGGYMVMLAGLHVVMGLVWGAVLIGATLPLSRALKRPGVVKAIDRVTGCVLIGFGAKLAFSRR